LHCAKIVTFSITLRGEALAKSELFKRKEERKTGKKKEEKKKPPREKETYRNFYLIQWRFSTKCIPCPKTGKAVVDIRQHPASLPCVG